ncbi:hypothetical protein E2C01_055806 [Portunus trituberculatus]|uniref:Uncharacterized protein n=1 Tax=Portunus trituberculatus TaxID=210409 RepID=A0A5B7GNQ9_PORTR|nr:hypothetical protein [Portunus trituberculatus]
MKSYQRKSEVEWLPGRVRGGQSRKCGTQGEARKEGKLTRRSWIRCYGCWLPPPPASPAPAFMAECHARLQLKLFIHFLSSGRPQPLPLTASWLSVKEQP